MTSRWIGLCWVPTLALADVAAAQSERHICRLLKADEVKTLVGPTVIPRT